MAGRVLAPRGNDSERDGTMQVTQYSPQQLVAFKEEFAAKRRRQLLAAIPGIAGVLAIAVLGEATGGIRFGLAPAMWQPLGIGIIVGVVGFSLYNWRCPACGRYLGRGWNPAYCAKCGIALRD